MEGSPAPNRQAINIVIVWQGWGIVVPVIGAVAFIGVEAVTAQLFGEGYMKGHNWPMLAACLVSAIAYWRLARWFEKNGDPHNFMFIPIRWWSYIVVALGVFLMFKPASQAPVSAREPLAIRRPTNAPTREPAAPPESQPVKFIEPAPAESPVMSVPTTATQVPEPAAS